MCIASLKSVRASIVAIASAAALASYACSTDSTPTGPDNPPAAAPSPTPAPTPQANNGAITVTVRPNPVPFSGQPITDAAGCAGSANTWFYDQVITETGGVTVHLTHRTDSFDKRVVNDVGADITIPARGTTTIKSRWCSAAAVFHTAQTTFTGADANGNSITASAGEITLAGK